MGFDFKTINDCANGQLGKELLLKNGEMHDTAHASATPWIIVNGVNTRDVQNKAYTNLLKYVCDTYTVRYYRIELD